MNDETKTSAQLIRDEKGNILNHEDTNQDLTRRRQAEEDLQESQGLYSILFEGINDAVFLHDLDEEGLPGRFLQVNNVACRRLGYTREELLSLTPRDITMPEEYARIADRRIGLASQGDVLTETVHLTKDGRRIFVESNICQFQYLGKNVALSISRDISERKQAEEALRASEQNFHRPLEESPLGIRIVTAEGETIYANRAILDIHGYASIEDLRTTPVKKRYAPESYAEFKIRREKRKRGDYDPSEYEISIIRKDGEVRYLQVFRKEVLWGGKRHFQVIYQDITERKRAEKTLQLITDNMSDMIRVTDLQGVNLYTSPSHFTVLGYKPEERVGKTGFDIVHPDDVEHLIKVFSEGIINKKPGKIEYRIKHAEGHYVWLETIADGIMDDHGEVTAVIQSSRDITERKQAEEALRKSQEQLRDAHRLAHIGVWNWIADTDTVTWTEELYRIAGLDPMTPAPTYTEHPNIYTPESWNRLKVAVEKTIEAGAPYQLELELIRPDGATRWVNAFGGATYDDHGRLTGLQGTVQDITSRKRAEEEVRRSNIFLNTIIENIPNTLFLKDARELRFLMFNRAAEDLTGYSSADVLGKNDYDFIPREQADFFTEKDREVLRGKDVVDIPEESLQTRTKGVRTLHTRKVPILNTSGDPEYLLGISEDITDRKQAEEEKRILQERIQRLEKMETMGNLAGGVAHDLNNLLGILVGYSELLSDEIDENSPLRKHVQTIMNSGERAAAVVQDLLTLACRGVVIRQTANLNRIVRDQLKTPELLELTLSHPRIRIKPNCDEDLLNIKGSAVHISATLTNLVLNAAEAMPEGGVISIRTENRHIDRPLAGYEEVQKGDYAVLSVSDTGSGISPEDMNRIFEPFYTRKVMGRSGSGLGLSVVWGTMKDHDGYIDVTTARGKGTTFTLYFPVTPDDFVIKETISVDEYMGKGESILVVDDEVGQRELATRMLTKLNYKATAVSSGEEAVEYLQQHDVDLVVLDMIMDPGIDGYETYRRIMELKKKQRAIIVSGFTETERVRMAKELGAGAFLKKPFLMEQLGLAVRKELE